MSPEERDKLVEQLAREVHRVWMNYRFREGWKGGQPDRATIPYHNLVDYGDLPESEKQLNREMVSAVLDAVFSPSAAPGAKDEVPLALDDMKGDDAIAYYQKRVKTHPECSSFLERLKLIEEAVAPAFRETDHLAIKFRRQYRYLSVLSVLLGAIAIGLAILQLTDLLHPADPRILPLAELAAGIATGAVALYSYVRGFREAWLLNRFMAEQLRLLKYSAVISRRTYCGEPFSEDEVNNLRLRVKEIQRFSLEALREWIGHSSIPADERAWKDVNDAIVHEVVVFYRTSRLHGQMVHLATRAMADSHHNTRTETLGLLFFWSSIVCVIAHVVLQLGAGDVKEEAAKSLVAAAAVLPAFAAAVRTYRNGREFARNVSRYETTKSVLERMSHALQAPKGSLEAIREVAFCEYVLEMESREFMRLMMYAEWFG